MNSKKCLWCSSTISEINDLRTLPEILTDQGGKQETKKMKYFEAKMSYPQFLKYLVPSVLTMIFLSFYTTIDGFFVSRYAGSDALAGINIVIPITCVIFGTSVMLATGSGAIIGERMGQKENRKQMRYLLL